MAKVIMFQGTGSDVGKSTLVAGLCRIAKNRGLKVAPFKPQNMSNNAAVCPPTGDSSQHAGEIGRAQALQAKACGLLPHVDMNPVLLKPQSDQTAQVIVQGKVFSEVQAKEYMNQKRASLMPYVLESFARLNAQYDVIFVEGAGSPAETNLRQNDIANMGFAQAVQIPVSLVADIDRGGVIASLAGTQRVLDSADNTLISSFIVNKFRGDIRLFDQGVVDIERTTTWTCHGVVPWLSVAPRLPQEDGVILQQPETLRPTAIQEKKTLKICAPLLSRIANFDDVDPLRQESNVEFHFIPPGEPIPLDTDVVLLLGTKSTLSELRFLKSQGWHHDIIALQRSGATVMGICGGFQMLGTKVIDEHGSDGDTGRETGLGLLDFETHMAAEKTTRLVTAKHLTTETLIKGYEIHTGRTVLGTHATSEQQAFSQIENHSDGMVSLDGRTQGTYIHGLFANDDFRAQWLEKLGGTISDGTNFENSIEQNLDELARQLEQNVNFDAILAEAKTPQC